MQASDLDLASVFLMRSQQPLLVTEPCGVNAMSQVDNSDQYPDPNDATVAAPAPRPLSGDRPKDTVAEDRLGYTGFAKALARAIKLASPREGMVLAVHGPWGSGKTSAVNMTVDALATLETEGEKTLVVRFNPWWFSEQENLTRAFFTEISAALGDKVSKDVQDGLKSVARRVGKGKDLAIGLMGLAPGGELLKAIGGAAFDGLAQYGEDAKKTLDEERETLRSALIKENKRILVIIDDVDRLPADEARQIFRLVKSVADLPNVIYLLVFDREVARRAMGEAATAGGPEWLEKIVQASFDLPAVHASDLLSLFTGELQEIANATKHNFEADRWPLVLHHCIAPWLRTARDVARLSNAVAVSFPGVSEEVDLADFVAIETMRLFEPRVFDLMRQHPDTLCGLNNDRDDGKGKDLAQSLLDAATNQHETLKSSLCELFPRLKGVWRNQGFGSGFLEQWDKAKRICSSRRFPAYVSFSLGEDVFSEPELQVLLATLSHKPTFDTLMAGYRKIRRRSGISKAALAVDEIGSAAETIAQEDLEGAARTLLWSADHLLEPADEAGFISLPNQWRISYVTDAILMRLPPDQRLGILEDMIQGSPALHFVGFMLTAVAAQHGLVEDVEETVVDGRLVDEAGLKSLTNLGAARFAQAARDGSLLGQSKILSLLYCWRRVADEATVKQWTDERMASDTDALRLANSLLGVVKTESGGVVQSAPRLDRKDTAALLDLERLEARIQEVKEGSARDDVEAQAIIERFQIAAAARR